MRRRISWAAMCCLIAPVLVTQPALAQPPAPRESVVVPFSNEVRVSPEGQVGARFYVDEAGGKPKTDVTEKDLTIRFGEMPAAGPVKVLPASNMPVLVALGLDVSLWNPRDAGYTSALTSSVLSASATLGGMSGSNLVAFPFSMTLPITPTGADLSWLSNRNLWQGNRTNLYGAIERAGAVLDQMQGSSGRKAIVILTNSGNTVNESQAYTGKAFINGAASAISSAKKAGAPVYVFAVEEAGHSLSPSKKAELETFVNETGGDFQVISSTLASSLPDALRNVMAALQSGYHVTFTSGVPVNQPHALEIGITPAKRARVEGVAPAAALTAELRGPSTASMLSETVELVVDRSWQDGIRQVQFFAAGKALEPVFTPPYRLTLRDIRELIRDWRPGVPLVVTATVLHEVNRVDLPQHKITIPPINPMSWVSLTQAGITTTRENNLYTDQVLTLTAQSPSLSNIRYIVNDRRGFQVKETTQTLVLPGNLLSGSYIVEVKAEDDLGRPITAPPVKLTILPVVPPEIGWIMLALVLMIALLVGIILAWLAAKQRRREAARAESTYRLVNYGNSEVEYVVLAEYEPSDLTLSFSLIGDQPIKAQPDKPGRLQLVTPPIKPQRSVQLRVVIDPVKTSEQPPYAFTLLARPKPLDDAPAQSHPFTLAPALSAQH